MLTPLVQPKTMFKPFSFICLNVFMVMRVFAQDASGGSADQTITAQDYRVGRVEHIVLFKYKKDVSVEIKQLIVNKFLGLKQNALRNGKPYILSIVSGPQNSLENLGNGFDQGFIVTFSSEGDRNYYVGRPVVNDPWCIDSEHDAFKRFIEPYLLQGNDGVLVFDFSVTT